MVSGPGRNTSRKTKSDYPMTDTTAQKEGDDRKHTRVPLEIAAELSVDGGTTYHGFTKNMSFGGAFIKLDADESSAPKEGDRCELRLILGAPEEPIKVPIQAKVARSDPMGVGIEFRSTTIEGYWHFKNLMVYNSPESDRLLEELEEHPGLVINH